MSGRRGQRQFGTIRKLPSGRWQARYRDPSGRQVSAPATFASKGDAAAYIAARQTDIGRSDYVDPRLGKTTLAEWAAQWLALPGKRPRASSEIASVWLASCRRSAPSSWAGSHRSTSRPW